MYAEETILFCLQHIEDGYKLLCNDDVIMFSLYVGFLIIWFTPTSQKHTSKWTDQGKLPQVHMSVAHLNWILTSHLVFLKLQIHHVWCLPE